MNQAEIKERQHVLERPKFGSLLLQQIEPSLRPYRENPKTAEYAVGIDATVRMFGDDFLPIPRPSGNEDEITAHLEKKAKGLGWYAEVDVYKNIGMVIPATPGHEQDPAILGHFHTDIVDVAGKHATTNPKTDPIVPTVVDIKGNQWIQAADDTTLGADDGAGAAAIIQAALDMTAEKDGQGNDIPHGPILLFGTSREETGLEGMKEFVERNAFNPEGAFAKLLPRVARILNSDGEQHDRLTIASLGAEQYKGRLPVVYETLPRGYELLEVSLDDFRGGHSGKYAANPSAFSALSEMMTVTQGLDVRVAAITTRNDKDNALAQNATITFAIPADAKETTLQLLKAQGELLKQRFEDDPITVSVDQPASPTQQVMNKKSSQDTLTLLSDLTARQGVEEASKVLGDLLLERSMNVGYIQTKGESVEFVAFARIRTPQQFGKYDDTFQSLAETIGLEYQKEAFDVWQPNLARQSEYQRLQQLYQDMFGLRPRLEFAPGGMEMTWFDKLYPEVLKVSNGATIVDPHKPGERMLAKSLAELYIWNRRILATWRDDLNQESSNQPLRRTEAE